MKVVVVNGPNLNLLGARDPARYGTGTLAELEAELRGVAGTLGVDLSCVQANDEGALVTALQGARDADGVILNPGGFTHTSVAIRDAVEAAPAPVIEVHLSNLHAREAFRRRSVIAGACRGQIAGLGVEGYVAALHALVRLAGQKG